MILATGKYEMVVGLEVHVQLCTKSKMFCSCRADYQYAPPNSLVCPTCMGMPGVLPVINKKAIEHTIMTGLALNCEIAASTKFDRKNYTYPDLLKGYQISQYDNPIAFKGNLDICVNQNTKNIGITRVHLEEDVAKLQHVKTDRSYSLVDMNRSGVPLMEIVSEPDMRSAEEAREYLNRVHAILQYLEVSTGNMDEGSFRCDANISLRSTGSLSYGEKVEIKNMNSFRGVYDALQYEVGRQTMIIEDGGRIVQETRGWDQDKGVTFSQRSKEDAHDYRYFPEPDLPILDIESVWVSNIASEIPELPVARRDRFVEQYGLSSYDSILLTNSRNTADYFEQCLDLVVTENQSMALKNLAAKKLSNWILVELNRLLNDTGISILESQCTPKYLCEMLTLVDSGTISSTMAKNILEECFNTGISPRALVDSKGYSQISDVTVLLESVNQAIDANKGAVEDFLNGKDTAAKFLVGQVMKLTRGQANPVLVNKLVDEKLANIRKS